MKSNIFILLIQYVLSSFFSLNVQAPKNVQINIIALNKFPVANLWTQTETKISLLCIQWNKGAQFLENDYCICFGICFKHRNQLCIQTYSMIQQFLCERECIHLFGWSDLENDKIGVKIITRSHCLRLISNILGIWTSFVCKECCLFKWQA